MDASAAAGLDFLLIGGHAVNAHGFIRTTTDFDFLIAGRDLQPWSDILKREGYHLTTRERPIRAFAQFAPADEGSHGVDLMLVDETTFSKLLAGSDWLAVGTRRVRVIGALHLIALKLHALKAEDRIQSGVDYLDIIQLVRLKRIDTAGDEFQEILNRYAAPAIKERLLRDIG